MRHIVIIGGSYAGVGTAHRILKQLHKTGSFKITIISPNTHLYWNMASPRGIIPGEISDVDLFEPILAGFEKYSNFELVHGFAKRLDTRRKEVYFSNTIGEGTLNYDILILATGSRTREPAPFKNLDSTDATRESLHAFQQSIKAAKSIVVGGAGVTGCEVAGELGYHYGREKRITLLSGDRVLENCPASVSTYVARALAQVNVDVQTAKVTSKEKGRLQLSSGKTITADFYIPTCGLVPNSSYIPKEILNASGHVVVDEHLKAATDVYAIGDVCATENSQFITCDRQSAYLAQSVVALLNGKPTKPYSVASNRELLPLDRICANLAGFLGLQIGKEAGTGHFGCFRIPSFVIVMARKNLFLQNLKPTVDGSLY